MHRLILSFLAVGALCFALGGWLGYRCAQRGRPEEVAGSAEPGRNASRQGISSGRPSRNREPRQGIRPADNRDREPEAENPFRDTSAADLVAFLNESRRGDNPRQFHQAMAMLTALARREPQSVIPLLASIKQHGIMHGVCRDLVSHGGKEGLDAVLGYITDGTGNMELRGEAIHALGSVAPEAQSLAKTGLSELMAQNLPRELQHPLCEAYGELSKDQAFQNLIGLLDDPACRVRPEFLVESAGRFGTPEDTSALLSLLGGSWTKGMEESILRAAARTAGNGEVLLDLLKEPPEGVDRQTIARALADAAAWSSLDDQTIIAAMTGESSREVRAELARALVRSGGEGLDRLLELAVNPERAMEACFDADSLAAALAESARPEFVPTMAELLGQVKDRETAHRLAKSIVEAGGRDGVETLLDLIADRTISGEKLHAITESIAEAGRPEDATRLFEILENTHHPDGARALLEAAYQLSGDAGRDHCLSLLREAADGDVRAAAADVLGRHDAGRHLTELVDVLGREEFGRAQWHLARAIADAGPAGLARLGEIMKGDGNGQRKHAILDVLSSFHLNESVGVLREAMAQETDQHLRARIAEAIAEAERRQ